MDKVYYLRDFKPEQIARAKSYIAAALIGLAKVKSAEHVDKLFDQLMNKSFDGSDKFTFSISFETLGNDFLAALGAADSEDIKDA